jgi:hypothetical protein
MKKVIFNYAIIAALALSAVCTSCKKDDNKNGNGNGNEPEKVQLVKTIAWYDMDSGEPYHYHEFKYDEKNRLTTITWYYMDETLFNTTSFTYSGDDLVKYIDNPDGPCIMDFSKNGNKIAVTMTESGKTRNSTIELDSDGYPIVWEFENETMIYQYLDGNLIHWGSESFFKHDNKKSPLYHCKSPIWYRAPLGLTTGYYSYYVGFKNNIIEINDGTGEPNNKTVFTYEYDENGFPTKMYLDGELYATFTY